MLGMNIHLHSFAPTITCEDTHTIIKRYKRTCRSPYKLPSPHPKANPQTDHNRQTGYETDSQYTFENSTAVAVSFILDITPTPSRWAPLH